MAVSILFSPTVFSPCVAELIYFFLLCLYKLSPSALNILSLFSFTLVTVRTKKQSYWFEVLVYFCLLALLLLFFILFFLQSIMAITVKWPGYYFSFLLILHTPLSHLSSPPFNLLPHFPITPFTSHFWLFAANLLPIYNKYPLL